MAVPLLVAETNDTLIAEALIAQAIHSGSAMRPCERVAHVAAEIYWVLVVEEIHDVVDRLREFAASHADLDDDTDWEALFADDA